ncbi:MAG: hypothetical protein Q7V05_01170 [Methanoregula sp.]|nr:hypothetical protein [Methanoregula sp.]MDP2796164.1 hypothetical protein [Methanoregula sp.]
MEFYEPPPPPGLIHAWLPSKKMLPDPSDPSFLPKLSDFHYPYVNLTGSNLMYEYIDHLWYSNQEHSHPLRKLLGGQITGVVGFSGNFFR